MTEPTPEERKRADAASRRRKYRAAHPDRIREQKRIYKAANRAKISAYNAARARVLRAERSAWLDGYRRALGCIDCGTREGQLDLDHRDETIKLFNPADGASRPISWERLKAEVAKCDVRCARCHGKRHAAAKVGSQTRVTTPVKTADMQEKRNGDGGN